MNEKSLEKAVARNFIIRIYRTYADAPNRLLGLVEEVGVNGAKSFNNINELWTILRHTEYEDSEDRSKG